MRNDCFLPAEILLPHDIDMQKWAVVAVDQFTGDFSYWENLKAFVGDGKSTLNLVLPEIYLNGDTAARIANINENIDSYLSSGVFTATEEGFILTVRKTPFVDRRIGLIGKIDLERYEYSSKSDALIRSTEGTIEERIPPRLKIRKDAKAEFTHAMILFDDEKREITEKLYENREKYKKLYDFTLNFGGGSIEGYFIPKDEPILKRFDSLLDEDRLIKKYGKADEFLFAVGDGNHSLATAKAHWNAVKSGLSESEKNDHPARYALVEAVNIYDEGIYFEPIYRFVSGVDTVKFTDGLKKLNADFGVYADKKTEKFCVGATLPSSITAVDDYIKEYIGKNGGAVDYIHGEREIKEMVDKDGSSVAILFDKMEKGDLFRFVSEKGSLPRKTFSMGQGVEKRYYLEGRKIVKE
ncbi:MAG: DUF1015 domain-containing protein [Clostridia bacterium]|nr:DUF1015 domain-containing protein [Clostridia bacterium]